MTKESEIAIALISRQLSGRNYSSEEFLEAQNNDVFLRKLKDQVDNHEAGKDAVFSQNDENIRNYFIRNKSKLSVNKMGLLVQKLKEGHVLLVPSLFRLLIISGAHDENGHPGEDKVFAEISKRYTWPGIREMIASYVRTCPSCQLERPGNLRKYRMPLTNIVTGAPN